MSEPVVLRDLSPVGRPRQNRRRERLWWVVVIGVGVGAVGGALGYALRWWL